MDSATDTASQQFPQADATALPADVRSVERAAHEWIQLVIRAMVLVLSIVLWSLIGFLVWVPLLLRAVVLMSGAVLYSSLLKRDTGRAEARLQHAMEFFPRGYERLFAAIRGETRCHEDDHDDGVFGTLRACVRFLLELFIAALFWYLLGIALRTWPSPSLMGIRNSLLGLVAEITRLFGGAA